jgi:hypothetical protein
VKFKLICHSLPSSRFRIHSYNLWLCVFILKMSQIEFLISHEFYKCSFSTHSTHKWRRTSVELIHESFVTDIRSPEVLNLNNFLSWCLTLREEQNQYNETNVMHFSFSLLRIKGTATVPQSTAIISTQYTKCFSAAPPEDEQVMLETCRGPWFTVNWIKVHHVGFIILIYYDARSAK